MTGTALLVGSSGRIGGALRDALSGAGFDVVATRSASSADGALRLDVRDRAAVAAAVAATAPAVVVMAVDGNGRARDYERDPAAAAALFVDGTAAVVEAAAACRARLLLYSSDLVFDGAGGPYGEDDPPRPATRLGEAKLAAERLVLGAGVPSLVVRTSEVFGWNRSSPNLAMEVWRSLASSQPVHADDEWWVTPTWAEDLAAVSARLLADGAEGTFHVAGPDRTTRHGLAVAVASGMSLDAALIRPVPPSGDGALDGPVLGGLVSTRLPREPAYETRGMGEAVRRFRAQCRAGVKTTYATARSSPEADELRRTILENVAEYHRIAHGRRDFVPYRTRVNYAGRVYGAEEMTNLVDASLDFWLTLGPWGDRFEEAVRDHFGAADFVVVNSGSAANLTAVLALSSPRVRGALRPGDEVITPAVTFPTTLAPIVHGGLVPVFVDCEIGTYNVDPSLLEAAISDRTRAMVLPHTLGNPCEMDVVTALAEEHGLFLVEDTCDAFGATYRGRPVGTFGHLATLSFYPAHHITMGEGGGVVVNVAQLARLVRSVRDWGRDCWCAPGESDTCGRRFGWTLGDLPTGYDHKYIYSNLGYNFKPTDLQAAIGVAQLARLPDFVARRRANFAVLHEALSAYEGALVLPRWSPHAEPSWFGFPITVSGGVRRNDLVRWLEAANIETRLVFAGNVLRQPAYRDVRRRVVGTLDNSDRVMRDTFFVGVHPGLTEEMLSFVLGEFERFFARRGNWS